MKNVPIIRPKKGELRATEFDLGICHHGFRLYAVIGDGIPILTWHTGPRTSSGSEAGLTSSGRKIVPCRDDGGRLERDVLTWLTK